MKPPILHIVDPAMSTHMGHHREINMALAQGMRARGYEVRVWVNKTYSVSNLDRSIDGIEIKPYFSVNPYAVFNSEGLSDLVERYDLAEATFEREIQQLALTGTVHIPNLFSYQLRGLSQLHTQHLSACVHHHPTRYSEQGEMFWSQSWVRAASALSHMKIVVVEEQMVNEMNRCIQSPMGVTRVPFPLAESRMKPQTHRPKTIGILGGVRREQGLRYIDQTIDIINSLGVEVVLQDVKGVLSDRVKSKRVQWLGFTHQFNEALALCGAVLLNYDPVAYRFMGSGILWEAASHGIVVLYTRGTAMSTMARQYGIGLDYSYLNKDSLKQAMTTYIEHHDQLHARAQIVAGQLRAEHSVSLHLDQVFA